MSIIQGISQTAAGGFDPELIGNSVWLDGSADLFKRTFSSASNQKRFILGTWIQRNSISSGTLQTIFATGADGSNGFFFQYQNATSSRDDRINIYNISGGSIDWNIQTSARFRDIAYYHILLSYESAAAETSRVQIYINGVLQTGLETASYPSLNFDCDWGSAQSHCIGNNDHNTSAPLPAYLSQTIYLDGNSIQNSDVAVGDFLDSFAYGDSGSQFGPRADTDITALASSAGGNSFCLNFEDGSNLGNDSSSNNNDFSATSMSAANQSSNTPSLNYATMDILKNDGSNTSTMVFSEGNTRVTGTGGSDGGSFSTLPLPTTGTTEFQTTFNNGDGAVGICCYDNSLAVSSSAARNAVGGLGVNYNAAYGYQENGEKVIVLSGGVTRSAQGDALTTNSVVTVRYDADSNEITFLKDNVVQGSAVATVAGLTYYAFAARFNNYDVSFHFESAKFPHTIGSGNLEMNSANVEPQTIQGVDGFITTLSTESNIVSAVATARSDWGTNYVDILKNRSSIETFLYRFGDDSSNEFTAPAGSYPSFSATYQSTSSLSGTDNWLGYSIRIGADYLTAAGSASHSNGSATTITHNLGTSRYCVLLFERGSSKDVWFHHPDFASGSLLKFVKDEALASSTQITTIGANSFQIGSGAATATYSYLVFADGGIASMGKYVGNGVVNGPYISMPHSSGFFARRSGGARSFWNNNSKSPGYNENGNYARFNDPQAEGTGSLKIDMLAGGIKIRDAYADQNTSGEVFYWISFGELSGGGESLPPVYGR